MAKPKDEAAAQLPAADVPKAAPVAEALPTGGGSYTRLPTGELVREEINNQGPLGQKE